MGNKRLQRNIGRWIIIGLICLIPVGVWAWGVLGLSGGVSGGGAGPDAWYYPDGSTTEPSWNGNGAFGTGYSHQGNIPIDSNGTITKIAVKLDSSVSGNIKLAIYNQSDVLHEASSGQAAVANVWNEYTLGSTLAVSASDIVHIQANSSDGDNTYEQRLTTSGTSYYDSCAYASFPCGLCTNDDSVMYAYRVYVD